MEMSNEQREIQAPSPIVCGESEIASRQIDTSENLPISTIANGLHGCLARVGTLCLTPQEQEDLVRPFPASAVRKLTLRGRQYDYLPHIEISRRLNSALGVGQWAIVRLWEKMDDRDFTVYGSYVLIVRGVWVADCVAGHQYVPSNRATDYADALESTRGIALRRMAAKTLGCGDQVWPHDEGEVSTPVPAVAQGPSQARADQQQLARDAPHIVKCYKLLEDAARHGTASLQNAWSSLHNDKKKVLESDKERLKKIAREWDETAGEERTGV